MKTTDVKKEPMTSTSLRMPEATLNALPGAAQKHMNMSAAQAMRFMANMLVDGKVRIGKIKVEKTVIEEVLILE